MKNNTNKKNKKKSMENDNRILFSILFIILTLCLILGVSFAVFTYNRTGDEPNQVTTGTLIVTLDDTISSGISVENALPTSDAIGKTKDPYKFTLENKGTINSNYRIKIINDTDAISKDGCSSKLLDYSQVRYSLVKDGVEVGTYNLDNDINGIIDSGTIEPTDKYTYELRLWIDSSITDPDEVNGKHLHVKIEVDATQDKYVDFDDID